MSHIKEEVDKILKLGGWDKLFAGLKARTNPYLDKFPATLASKDQNFAKNRYRDVLPYDSTRVKLEADDGGDGYINASYVHIERARRKYILTQGPLQNTMADFWHMIWEQKCPAIIMLNKYNENNFPKCHAYVPDSDEDVMIVDSAGTRVKLVSRTPMPSYVCSKIEIDRQGNVDGQHKSLGRRTVIHYQYTEWPDFGVPSCPDKFLDFLGAIRDSGVLSNTENEPVAIHCSAGIGRSGTFVMVDTSLVLISENVRVDVISLLEDLRQYRYGLVQTAEQLRFTYEAIIKGVEKFIGPLDEVGKRLTEPHPRLTPFGDARSPGAESALPVAGGSPGKAAAERSGSKQQDRPLFRRQAGRLDSLAEHILLEDSAGGGGATTLEMTEEEDEESISPLPTTTTTDTTTGRPQSSSTLNGASEHDDDAVVGVHDNDTGRLSVAAMNISDRGGEQPSPDETSRSRAHSNKRQQRDTPSPRPSSRTKDEMKRSSPADAITATPNPEAVSADDGGSKDDITERQNGSGSSSHTQQQQTGKADDADICDKKDGEQLGGVGVSDNRISSSSSSNVLRERRLERSTQMRQKLDRMLTKQHDTKAADHGYISDNVRKYLIVPAALAGLSLIVVGGLALWRLATTSPH